MSAESSRQSGERPSQVDPIWFEIRREAEQIVAADPAVASFVYATVLNHERLEAAVIDRIAGRLGDDVVSSEDIRRAFEEVVRHQADLGQIIRADLAAVFDRDPACERMIEPLLYFKGFHAIQTQRLAHWLWHNGRRDFALYLQSRSSSVFQTDIHPAVPFGRGIFLDHATGLVVGGTATIDDNVSILQGVSLGGTGKVGGNRHPKVRQGVLIGAGATVLGDIEIGESSKIAAGSVVLHTVAPHTTVAGVPANVVGKTGAIDPSREMDQMIDEETDE